MKQGLSLRVSQHLTLTPQLQQSIRLLQLSTLELEQEVEQMLDDNPFLEREEEAAEAESFGPAPGQSAAPQGEADGTGESADFEAASGSTEPEADWEGDGTLDMAPDDKDWGGDAIGASGSASVEQDANERNPQPLSLQMHLSQQASALRLRPEERAALQFLIGSLNEDGYLEDSLPALALSLSANSEQAEDELMHLLALALNLLQSFEPPGVGAHSLSECLRLQLRALPEPAGEGQQQRADVRAAALAMCDAPLLWLATRDLKRLAQHWPADEATLRAALALISSLNPKPGQVFEAPVQQSVTPDVLVSRVGSGAQPRFQVRLNDEVIPRLRVFDHYAKLLKGNRGHPGLQSQLQEARWFIKNVRQRFDTILRVSRAIVERQKSFLVHGELAMRPLVLREIAEELGLHESTISRVTTAKYMATPMGTYELKFFFGSALGTETGGNASSTAVRALIRQFVAAESPLRPLNDNQISDMLREQGIACARRTVAKYREALRIAPAQLRKALQP